MDAFERRIRNVIQAVTGLTEKKVTRSMVDQVATVCDDTDKISFIEDVAHQLFVKGEAL